MTNTLLYRIIWVMVFSMAMGLLETAVVVYLRDLYYPNGFDFPLVAMSESNALVELLREAATIVMLAGIGALTGYTFNQRFAYFLTSFAIWDIFYYVFLKLFIDWPESLFTWDILFLIPVPWFGPVITPCIISITMLALASALVIRDSQLATNRLSTFEWLLLVVGSVVIIASWTWDYLVYSSNTADPMNAILTYVPKNYLWLLFWIGEAILLAAIFLFWRRTKPTLANSL